MSDSVFHSVSPLPKYTKMKGGAICAVELIHSGQQRPCEFKVKITLTIVIANLLEDLLTMHENALK